MNRFHSVIHGAAGAFAWLVLASLAFAQSPAEGVLAEASQQGKFTFILFWKQSDAATAAMVKNLEAELPAIVDRAESVAVQVGDPTEAKLVERFGVSRAPLPLVLAVAPNGAVTGFFQKPITKTEVDKALVTPTMTRCMKAMQDGKIVVVCAQPGAGQAAPLGARQFHAHDDFRERTVLVQFSTLEPAEARFVRELQIAPQDPQPYVALLAPPGVLVGKFKGNVTAQELAAKLHAAGKCCDDENCKHNKPVK